MLEKTKRSKNTNGAQKLGQGEVGLWGKFLAPFLPGACNKFLPGACNNRLPSMPRPHYGLLCPIGSECGPTMGQLSLENQQIREPTKINSIALSFLLHLPIDM